MTDHEAMQLALEALENVTEDYVKNRQYKHNKAITALRERLAQPEQRPVPPPWWPAVENILNEYGLQAIDFVDDFKKALAQPEQEPVAWVLEWIEDGEVYASKLYESERRCRYDAKKDTDAVCRPLVYGDKLKEKNNE